MDDMRQTWADLEERLAHELQDLDDGASLVLSEPDQQTTEAAPPRWKFWQRRPFEPSPRYVQFTKYSDALRSECVSNAYRDVSEPAHRKLLALGWRDPDAKPRISSNYWREDPPGHERTVARLAVRSLATLGGHCDTEWTWLRID